VVEGIVHDNLGDNFVKISKTRTYDNNGAIEKVSNATVQVFDGVGGVFTLLEVDTIPGYYTSTNLEGIAGRTYQLNVNVDGNSITASSKMSPRIEIDSLSYDEEPSFGGDEEPSYGILCHFTDPANVINFYRMKSFLGEEQIDGYVNWSDDAIDGASTGLPVFNVSYAAGEVATIQLLSVDEPNFRYFVGVASSQEGEVPGNPESNLTGENVVGYFGAYAKSEASILIDEE
ncbi:MAG: DUF4249 family protein, partial [Vicingaceae bacterium]|nr:DUF4249 family protein [Vicingaceae bacterium]